ncbi:MAG: DUF4199 family protein [Rikenellaceae bacterium]
MLNDIAKWGLILGVVMSLSRIVEFNMILSGDVTKFSLLALEWPLSIAVYVYIIYRANKRRAASMPKWVGYPMGVAINYAVTISIFASLIVGICSHIYVVGEVGGYDVYTARMLESLEGVVAQTELSDSTQALYDEAFSNTEGLLANAKDEPAPSMFSTLISIMSNYIISGFIIGFIVSFFVRRKAEVADVINDMDDPKKE